MKYIFLSFLLVFTLKADVLQVTASIVPQKFFINKIAKDKVHVNIMVKPGFSPATYEPKTSQMKALSKSKVYFSIGVAFEDVWLKRFAFANKKMLIKDTSEGIHKIEIQEHEHHEKHDEHDEKHDDHDEKHDDHDEKHDDHDEDNEHAQHHEHEEGGLDPHIWLDPILVKTQAKNIYETLVLIDSTNKDFYKTNYEAFLSELDVLHNELKDILKDEKGRAFMVFHPSWGYFAKRYSLEQIAVESEGKEPKPKAIIELINEAREHNIKIIFVAAEFSQKAAHTIAHGLDGNIVTINPLDIFWDDNLKITAQAIKESYK